MLNIQTISTIVGIFIGLGAMIGGCGYGYSSWKNGNNKYKDETISDLKIAIETKEKEISRLNEEKTILILSHQKQITEIQKELSELQGAFKEQSKKLGEYRSILENRNPELLGMLTEIKDGITTLNTHGVTSGKQAKEVAITLKQNNK